MAKVMRSLSAKSVMASPLTLAITRTAWAEAGKAEVRMTMTASKARRDGADIDHGCLRRGAGIIFGDSIAAT